MSEKLAQFKIVKTKHANGTLFDNSSRQFRRGDDIFRLEEREDYGGDNWRVRNWYRSAADAIQAMHDLIVDKEIALYDGNGELIKVESVKKPAAPMEILGKIEG